MSYPGRLRSRVTIFRRSDPTEASLGAWVAGASRRAEIVPRAGSDAEIAAGIVGLDTVTITVRADAETRSWDTSMRLREDFGPARQARIFELVAPGQPDAATARWLTFQAVAGGVRLD